MEQKELYSLLIPLQNERLLVPRMCVAEVIAFADTARSRDDAAPDWYLGAIEWNNRRVPVVSFDAPKGDERKSKRSRTRVVVFHAITQELKGGYYGILTQGFPQLVRVNPDVLGLETEQPLPEFFPAICRARMIHEYPLVPDVERLEKMIAELPLTA
ncbi:MAG TPA: chemotaxis protein CheW [Gammaproteobacteria bacterium]|nr:chemotaxis protein CheW [Gammaproteobacteria bacterium]